MLRAIIVSAAAISAMLCVSAPASAEQVSLKVHYSDLNLASGAGQRALDRRIEAAVKTICGQADVPDTVYRAIIAPCQQQAREAARLQAAAVVANAKAAPTRLATR